MCKIIKKEYFPLMVNKKCIPMANEYIRQFYISEVELYEEKPFTGIQNLYWDNGCISKYRYVEGILHGEFVFFDEDNIAYNIGIWINGLERFYFSLGRSDNEKYIWIKHCCGDLLLEDTYHKDNGLVIDNCNITLTKFDLDFKKILSANQDIVSYHEKYGSDFDSLDIFVIHADTFVKRENVDKHTNQQRVAKTMFAYFMEKNREKGIIAPEDEFIEYYIQQDELCTQVITENYLPEKIKYIAGVDVAYHDLSQKMVGAVVVLDAETLEVVDSAVHIMDVSFPYIPGLFSFREIPPILEAYKKLKILPDLIVCDGQGIAHPKNIGMASHLGIELNIPTIGCAKKRLVGFYEKDHLGKKRGDFEELIWEDRVVGKALRTQTDVNPVFVSIGHKIDLATSVEWVMKLTPKYRLPETTRQADQLVNQYLKEHTDYDFFNDEGNNQ